MGFFSALASAGEFLNKIMNPIAAGYSIFNNERKFKQSEELNARSQANFEKQSAFSNQQFEYQKAFNANRYQIETSDRQAAGLNPLTATGGGSVGSFSASSPSLQQASTDTSALSSILSIMSQEREGKKNRISQEGISDSTNRTQERIANFANESHERVAMEQEETKRQYNRQQYLLARERLDEDKKKSESEELRANAIAEAQIDSVLESKDNIHVQRERLLRDLYDLYMAGGAGNTEITKLASDAARMLNTTIAKIYDSLRHNDNTYSYREWRDYYFPSSERKSFRKVYE